jgi:glutathione S-transferase
MRTLYHLPLSPYSRKVRLVLAEKRLPFDLRTEKPWERRADYLELNPAGTVPTLVEDNGLVVADSGVICEYLEEAYPDTPLLGRTLAERVEARRLVAWFDGKFAAEVTRGLLGEKVMKRMSGRGNPDGAAHRLSRTALSSGISRLAGGDADVACGQHHDAGRLRRRGASVVPRLHR